MEGQKIPKLPGKLITRSKSKTSVGDRELVNFLENLSKDETGAPVKWKFNKSGIRFAKGIGKKIADASKPSSAVYVDSTIKLARSVLRKHVKKQIISDQSLKYKKQLELKSSQEELKSSQEQPLPKDSPIKRKRGRPKKIVREKDSQQQQCESAKSAVEIQPVPRKRGRPRKVDKISGGNEKEESKSWTQLSKKVFQQSSLGLASKRALQIKMRYSSEERGDSDRIDSEIETESIDSNISGCSELKKQKKRNHHGIKLGPKKLLRSQDSLVTRHVKVNGKPRKRTLSGEFELLDENSLRKKMKQNDDVDEMTVNTDSKVHNEKKRGRPPKAVSASKLETEANDNLSQMKDSFSFSSLVEGQEKDLSNNETVQTFSVKSMKHPSLLRKPEIRKINKKKSEDVKTPPSVSTKIESKNFEDFMKKKPDKPSNKPKAVSTSLDKTEQNEKDSDVRSEFTHLHQKINISVEPKSEKPVRGLQIVGPGGMKFTKKAKCDPEDNLQKKVISPILKKPEIDQTVSSNVVNDKSTKDNDERVSDNVGLKQMSLEANSEIPRSSSFVQNNSMFNAPQSTINENLNSPDYSIEKELLSPLEPQLSSSDTSVKLESKDMKAIESSEEETGEMLVVTLVSDFDTSDLKKEKSTEMESKIENETSKLDVEESKTSVDNDKEHKNTENTSIVPENITDRDSDYEISNVHKESDDSKVETDVDNSKDRLPAEANEQNTKDIIETVKEIDEEQNIDKENFPQDTEVMNVQVVERKVEDNESNITNDSKKNTDYLSDSDENVDVKNIVVHSSALDECKSFANHESSVCVRNDVEGKDSTLDKQTFSELESRLQTIEKEESVFNMKHDSMIEKHTINDGSMECSSSSNEPNLLIASISETKGVDNIIESAKFISTDCEPYHDLASLKQKDSEPLEKLNNDICCEKDDLTVTVHHDAMSIQSKLADIAEIEKDQEAILHEMEGYSRKEIEVKRPEDEIAISNIERSVTPNSDEDHDNSISEMNINNVDSLLEPNQGNSSKSDKGFSGKRQIQLRQKASRSPLEIIAMRQSLEERQYLLEQSQKALKREEKQKKMKEKHKKIVEDDKEKEIEKDGGNEIPKEIVKESDEEHEKKTYIDELIPACKPCSVVLIDFVKYLKTTKTSYSVESGSVLEEWETVEDNESAVSPRDSSEPTTSDQENLAVAKLEADEDSNIRSKHDADETKINKDCVEKVQEDIKPSKRKRKASARKQVRSVTYSAQLTAEIVSNPMLLYSDETQTTVPPLRLKIKQNIIAKPRIHRQRRGLKFTTKKQHKARKGMSPVKSNPPPAVIDAAIAASEPEHKKQKLNDVAKEGFVGSFVQFIQNRGESSSHTKSPKLKTDSIASRLNERKSHQGYGTLTGDNLLPRFRCTYIPCSFVTSSKSIIESHIYVHLKNIPFKCCYCNDIFTTRNSASVHMRSVHPNLEAKIEPAESVNERLYYEELLEDGKSPVRSSAASVTSDKSLVNRSPEAVVIKVVLPQSDTGCYYCIYCDFSAANQQEILDHIHHSHDHDAQYTCSICKKVIQGSKEDISKHFADAHPNQQLMYKYLPEFYESNKIVNQDKGNIFDRMNDLFSSNESGNQQKFPEKTSAEADSTTVEMDEMVAKDQPGKNLVSEERSEMDAECTKQLTTCDGQVAPVPVSELSTPIMQSVEQFDRKSPRSIAVSQPSTPPTQNDMGLKIVDVVSLRDHIPNEWLSHQDPNQTKPHQQEAAPVEKTQSFSSEYNRPVSIIDTVRTGGRLQQRPSINITQSQMPKVNSSKDTKITNGNFGTTYKCEKCNVHAPVLSAMVEHLRVTHKDIARLFLCPYCRQYEGASEPEIHRHIKQYHHSPDQKSPPVALSSAAKKHLRTIQVPAGDARKIGDKFVIERDIYKCLKCQKHMPSLDYIYDHLEKTHNEVFVYVCPYCKIFKAKKEEVVFHHIRNDHNKNATDIMLSLAIEENLFTRVQSLMKERQKSTQKTAPTIIQSNTQQPSSVKTAEEDVIVVGESRPQTVISQINSSKQVPNVNPFVPNFRPSLPLTVNQQPVRMPFQTSDRPNTYAYQPRTTSSPLNIQSKSSLRKSRPHHIPPQNPFTQRNIGTKEIDKNEIFHQTVSNAAMVPSQSAPPPLIRGPPPLLKVTQESRPQSQHAVNQMQMQQQIRHMSQIRSSFPTSKPLGPFSSNSVAMQSGQVGVQSMTNTMPGFPRNSRPVLKVPSVTSQLNRQSAAMTSRVASGTQNTQKSNPSFSNPGRSDGTVPLDLSRPVSDKPSSIGPQSQADDDLPPDAFQIFNLRPAGPRMSVQRPLAPVQNLNRAQFHARMSPPVQRMGVMPTTYRPRFPNNYSGQIITRQPPPYNAIPASRLNSALTNNNIMNKNVHLQAASIRQSAPQTSSPSPVDAQKGAQNLAVDNQRVFKCPYCPNIVPLSMGEVAPHTEKNHPGHSIVFMKIDKLT